MNQYLVCKKQNVGRAITIGSGMIFYIVEAESIQMAKQIVIWPEGKDGYSIFETPTKLFKTGTQYEKIYVIPMECVEEIVIPGDAETLREIA